MAAAPDDHDEIYARPTLDRLDERLRWLVKTVAHVSKKVEGLESQVTRLVVMVGLVAFLGSAVVSVIVGVLIKWIAK